MTLAAIFKAVEPKRASKNCGIVALPRCWLIMRVLLPRMTQARREPISVLPIPIQVDAIPYFQPNWPA